MNTQFIILSHNHNEEECLKSAGFTNVTTIIFTLYDVERVQTALKGASNTLLIIDDKIMRQFPSEVLEILEYINVEAPDVLVNIMKNNSFPAAL